MVFNSIAFLIFLAIVLALYYRLPQRWQNPMLVAASYLFYGWWDWRFLGLLFVTTFFDYWCARLIERETIPTRRKWFLAFSMTMNLSAIGFFKYFNFFAESFGRVLNALGMQADLPTLHILLPVGISFYTFLSMSYTIDVYRGQVKAARNPLDFMLYVSFFPHLVAGPIMRAQDLLPQCQRPRTLRQEEILNGIWLCLQGYFKKVVIADRLGAFVNWGFSSGVSPYQDANSWLLLYAFAFQIYGDFSGYSDIARGLAKLMGFELVHNFKAPYLVSNPAAFWRNWHISLSTWLRDYLYIPLGGNRKGPLRTNINLMLTMLLGGLWHGAGFAFLVWGLYHGALLVAHRAWASWRGRPARSHMTPLRSNLPIPQDGDQIDSERPRIYKSNAAGETPAPPFSARWIANTVMTVAFFHITCLGWLLFRAGTVPAESSQMRVITSFLEALWKIPAAWSPYAWPVILLGGAALLLQWKHQAADSFARWPAATQAVAVFTVLATIAALGVFEGGSFIYFQF